MNGSMDGLMNEWMNVWIRVWMNGRMNKWLTEGIDGTSWPIARCSWQPWTSAWGACKGQIVGNMVVSICW